MNALKTTVLILALVGSGSALADGHEHGKDAKGMSCGMMDMDGMSAEDRKAKMDQMFGKLDADKDGSISRAEFDRHHADMMAEAEKRRKAHDHVEQHK